MWEKKRKERKKKKKSLKSQKCGPSVVSLSECSRRVRFTDTTARKICVEHTYCSRPVLAYAAQRFSLYIRTYDVSVSWWYASIAVDVRRACVFSLRGGEMECECAERLRKMLKQALDDVHLYKRVASSFKLIIIIILAPRRCMSKAKMKTQTDDVSSHAYC